MLHDALYAIRTFRRSPGSAVVALLVLSLGIGANTAVFSIVDAALFRPLPYDGADRLVDVIRVAELRGGAQAEVAADGRLAQRLRDVPHVFEGVEGVQ